MTRSAGESGALAAQVRAFLKWRRWRRWALLGGGAVVLALATALAVERVLEWRDARRFPPPGKLVDVGSHRMHLHCLGTGRPTVVLEAGLQFWSSQWYWVQRQVAGTTRACAYDRSGLGWSELGTGAPDGESMMRELRTLLSRADETGPYVLVGHSLGGMLIRIAYQLAPDDVAGMVFVDPGIPTEFVDPGEDLEAGCGWRCPAARFLAALGLFRWANRNIMTNPEYPEEVVPETRAFLSSPRAMFATTKALSRIAKTSVQTMAADDFGAVPVVLLRSDDFRLDGDLDPETRQRRLARRERLLRGMDGIVNLSSRGRGPVVVEGSNHESIIMYERHAEIVSGAILRLVETVRMDSSAVPGPGRTP